MLTAWYTSKKRFLIATSTTKQAVVTEKILGERPSFNTIVIAND